LVEHKKERHKNYSKTTKKKNTHDISQIQLCESLNDSELGEPNNLRVKVSSLQLISLSNDSSKDEWKVAKSL